MPSPELEDERRVDAWLRRTLEPQPSAVRRVATAALEVEPPHRLLWRTLVVGVVLALALGLIVAWPERGATRVDEEPPEVVTISNRTGQVTVLTPDGSSLVLLSGGQP